MGYLRLTGWLIIFGTSVALLIAVFAGPRLRERFNPKESKGDAHDEGDAAEEEPSSSAKDSKESRGLGSLATPLITLTVLLLSFTLVQTWGSFRDAIDRTGREARSVDYLADVAAAVPGPEARTIRESAICYARAVTYEEWPVLRDWPDVTVPGVDRWTDELEGGLTALAVSKSVTNPFTRELIAADRDRALYRGQRLTEVRATIPIEITVLLLVATMMAIIVLGITYMERTNRVLQVCYLTVLAGLFAAVLGIVTGLDTPYSGVIALEPSDMERVAQRETASFAEDLPGAALPCDEQGQPLAP